MAVGIVIISYLQAGIELIPVWLSPYIEFPVSGYAHGIRIMAYLKLLFIGNMGIVVEISFRDETRSSSSPLSLISLISLISDIRYVTW
jgi:hypothetical protein